MASRWRTVGEVADLAGVTVRTLHHYDRIGLVVPSARTDAGYRMYDRADLERLQEVLVHRSLGFGLPEIRALLDDPARDRRSVLAAQREHVLARRAELDALLDLVDRTLATLEGAAVMDDAEMFEGLEGFDPTQYEDEVRERWGDTDAYRESARRTKGYRAEDWARIQADGAGQNEALAALMAQGVPPEDPRAMDLAEQARLFIDRWFYPCSHEMHARLGDMYVADERFTAHYDAVAPGLAAYLRDAIVANGLRALG